MIKEYQNSLARAISGYVYGLADDDLDEDKIDKVKVQLNKLKFEDYLQLSFDLNKEDYPAMQKTLHALGFKEIKGFPKMESRTIKNRNPMVLHAKRRGMAIEDPKRKQDQKDKWSRNAKHKDLKMKKVDESILGLGEVPVVGRLQELAGIKSDPKLVQERAQKLRHIRELEDFDDVDPFDDMENDDLDGLDNMDSTPDYDDVDNDSFDDDFDVESDPTENPEITNVPEIPNFSSTLSPDMAAPVGIDHSPAYTQILASLESINNQLQDIKMSEYKDILTQLKQMHQSVRDAGYRYLQESRQKKDR